MCVIGNYKIKTRRLKCHISTTVNTFWRLPSIQVYTHQYTARARVHTRTCTHTHAHAHTQACVHTHTRVLHPASFQLAHLQLSISVTDCLL